MDFSIIKDIGQVVVALGFMWFFIQQLKAEIKDLKNGDVKDIDNHVTSLLKDLAVLQERSKDSQADHDKLVSLGERVKDLKNDLNAAHQKLRDLEREKK